MDLRHNPVSNFIFGSGPQNQPGVGGKLRDFSHPLQHDPISGAWFDPQTGTSYLDPQGTQPITNPNIAQQVATNIQRSGAFLGQLGQAEQQQQQVFGQQQGLANNLNSVITGRAPSLAAEQAQLGANQASNQQFSAAAGTAGPAGPLAQMLAARNAANIQVGANNAGTMARTKEEMDARNSLAELLASMGQGVSADANRLGTLGTNFSQQGLQGQESQQGLNRQADAQRSNQDFQFGGAFVNGIANNLPLPKPSAG